MNIIEIGNRKYMRTPSLRGILVMISDLGIKYRKNKYFRCAYCHGKVHRYDDFKDPLRCKKEECRTLQSMEPEPEEAKAVWSLHSVGLAADIP